MNRRNDLMAGTAVNPELVKPALLKMNCDGAGAILCPYPANWGVRVHVPSKTQNAPGHDQVRMTLRLHACEKHKEIGCFKLENLLTERLRGEIEQFAKKKRPIDWKADFEAAFVQYVDVFDPQYKKFLAITEGNYREAAEQIWGAPISNA